MQKVADARGEEAEGVPYIIIGDQSWNGFSDEYKNEILKKIETVYEQEVSARYDIMQLIETGSTNEEEKDGGNDFVSLIIILVLVGAAGFGIYKARETVNE